MNNDLISRSELKKEVENLVAGGAERLKDYYENGSKREENEWIGGVYDVWELIDNAPTVEGRMTNKEAIKIIKAYKDRLTSSCSNQLDEDICALDLAIKALEERPTGEWLDNDREDTYRRCSICNELVEKDNYCGNCGADMRKGDEE